ncbi:MAG: hypothetical protein Q9195_003994 [Heterodermia aff. obscurata]
MYFARYLLPTLIAGAFASVLAALVPQDQLSSRSDLDPASVEVSSVEERHPAGETVSGIERRNEESGDVTDADEAVAYPDVGGWCKNCG